MFDLIAKAGFFLLRPSNFLLFLFVGGIALVSCRFARLGRAFVAIAAVGLCIGAFSPLANILLLPLEERFPPQPILVGDPDGIVILGGALDTLASRGRSFPAVERPAERIMAVPELARRYPDARIVISGGTAGEPPEASEAAVTSRLLEEFGVAAKRMEIEGRSLNTWQNAVNSYEVALPKEGERWLLVTSAAHMPRAIGAFRKAGWSGIVAYPVDWETDGKASRWRWFTSASQGLSRVDAAVREWIGLIAYRLSGRSGAFFPGPAE